jgi:fructokinase
MRGKLAAVDIVAAAAAGLTPPRRASPAMKTGSAAAGPCRQYPRPHAIVRGGGRSKIARLYERLPGLLAPYVFSDRVATRILAPRHGDASGVRGAAWLWRPEEAD